MNQNIPPTILEQTKDVTLSPEILKVLGRKAAIIHEERSLPLTEAVIKAIGMEKVTPEHARRICEFANHEAFKRGWERGGEVRNIEFPGGPADVSEVLIELNKGAREAMESSHPDYNRPPVERPIGAVEEEIFGSPKADPDHGDRVELERLRMKTADVHKLAKSRLDELDLLLDQASYALKEAVAREVAGGEELGKIASAWRLGGAEGNAYLKALGMCSDDLVGRGAGSYESLHGSLEKTASSIFPNPDHPCVTSFREFKEIVDEREDLMVKFAALDKSLIKLTKEVAQRYGISNG